MHSNEQLTVLVETMVAIVWWIKPFPGMDPQLVWRRPTRHKYYQWFLSLQSLLTLAGAIGSHQRVIKPPYKRLHRIPPRRNV